MLYIETILFQLALFISTSTLLLALPDNVLNSFISSKLAVAIDFYHVQQKFPSFLTPSQDLSMETNNLPAH